MAFPSSPFSNIVIDPNPGDPGYAAWQQSMNAPAIPYWQNPNYKGSLAGQAPPTGKVWDSRSGTWVNPPTQGVGGGTGGPIAIPGLTGGSSPPPEAFSGQIPLQNQQPAGPSGFTNFINSFNPTLPTQQNQGTNVTQQAVGNNLASAPSLASLTQLINQLNLQAQQAANAARIPNATGLETQSSGNIGSLLSGVIPQDVQTQLAQSAAERGIGMGSPGSDNVNSSLLRSLGLTSLGLQQQGQQDLTAALARNPGAPLFDPTNQLITPYQQGNLNNQANQLALEWAKMLNQLNLANRAARGGGGGQQQQQPQTPDMSWFSRALQSAGGLNQPVGAQNIFAPPPSTFDPNNPFDPLNQYYNVTSDPTLTSPDQAPGYVDLGAVDFGTGDGSNVDLGNSFDLYPQG